MNCGWLLGRDLLKNMTVRPNVDLTGYYMSRTGHVFLQAF